MNFEKQVKETVRKVSTELKSIVNSPKKDKIQGTSKLNGADV